MRRHKHTSSRHPHHPHHPDALRASPLLRRGGGGDGAGFTLVELLIVIAIIGVLATVAFLALNRTRGKARDAKRISDVRQVQSALELYFNDQVSPHYPIMAPRILDEQVLPTIYLADVPDAPTPFDNPQNSTACSDASANVSGARGSDYLYTSTTGQYGTACSDSADTDCGRWYKISFCLGGVAGAVSAGCNIADPAGITADSCL